MCTWRWFGATVSQCSIEQRLTACPVSQPAPTVPLPILADHVASTLLNLLRWWLEHDRPYTPREMDEMFVALVRGTV